MNENKYFYCISGAVLKSIVCILLIWGNTLTIASQTIEEQINEAIEKNDYLALKSLNINEKDVNSPLLISMSDALIKIGSNKPLEAIESIKILLADHQHELGSGVLNFLILLSEQLSSTGAYGEAAGLLAGIINQIDPQDPSGIYQVLDSLHKKYKAMADVGGSEIRYTSQNMKTALFGLDTEYIFLKASLAKEEIPFLLDTGAGGNLLTKELARKYNVKIMADSLVMMGFGKGYAQIGIAENFKIGNIEIKNMPFYVVDEIVPADIRKKMNFEINAILGIDFLKLVNTLEIDFKEKTILFPSVTSQPEQKMNMMISNSALYVQIFMPTGERALMLLDTGDISAGHFKKHYSERYPSLFETTELQKSNTSFGGFGGGINNADYYILPSFALNIGNHTLKTDISIDKDNHFPSDQYDGFIGIGTLKRVSKVKIDLKHMLLTVE